jgi:hypothetical protein
MMVLVMLEPEPKEEERRYEISKARDLVDTWSGDGGHPGLQQPGHDAAGVEYSDDHR